MPGRPLSNETVLVPSEDKFNPRINASSKGEALSNVDHIRRPADIRIVRHRMLYAKAALNAKGEANLGLRHIRRCTGSASSYSMTDLDRCL